MLASAMKTCRVGNTAEPLDTSSCFGANSLYTNAEKDACSNSVKDVVPENTGSDSYIKALPGCNPIQPGPGLATIQTGCSNVVTSFGDGGDLSSNSEAGSSTSTSVTSADKEVRPVVPIATATQSSATVSPSETSTSSGSTSGGTSSVTAADGSTWTAYGCYVDTLNPRTLANVGWWGNPITNAECAKGCSKNGFSISGAENGGQCFCGNELAGGKKAASSECNSPCVGDSSQTCGGPARLSVYKKSPSKSKKHRAHRHLGRHPQGVS